ncbi:hypothetical protein PRIPAC_92783 [Pristionchus pacificus]|nr:hypothetical protein PRIPAC_92783 [Pristionchus pacificus]
MIRSALFVLLLVPFSIQEGKHWQWRALDCVTTNGTGPDHISKDPAQCSLNLFEAEHDTERRPAKGPICHDEVVNGVTRSYCNLLCPGADTVYLIKRKPQTHRSCFVFYTHELEKRGQDYYLWRINKCRHSQIEITVRCEFLFGREDFATDNELFAKLR